MTQIAQIFLTHMIYVYTAMAARESMLLMNGSHIRAWWILHHYLSACTCMITLALPVDSPRLQSYIQSWLHWTIMQSALMLAQNRRAALIRPSVCSRPSGLCCPQQPLVLREANSCLSASSGAWRNAGTNGSACTRESRWARTRQWTSSAARAAACPANSSSSCLASSRCRRGRSCWEVT